MNKESIVIQLKELADQNGVCFDEEILSRAVELAQFRLFPKGTTLKSIGDKAQKTAFVLDLKRTRHPRIVLKNQGNTVACFAIIRSRSSFSPAGLSFPSSESTVSTRRVGTTP